MNTLNRTLLLKNYSSIFYSHLSCGVVAAVLGWGWGYTLMKSPNRHQKGQRFTLMENKEIAFSQISICIWTVGGGWTYPEIPTHKVHTTRITEHENSTTTERPRLEFNSQFSSCKIINFVLNYKLIHGVQRVRVQSNQFKYDQIYT